MPIKSDKPKKEPDRRSAGGASREPSRRSDQGSNPDSDQLTRSRTPELVPPGTIIQDDEDDHRAVEPERTGLRDAEGVRTKTGSRKPPRKGS